MSKAEYIITTDNMADLPKEYLKENGIDFLSLNYIIDGETYDEFHSLSPEDFYDKVRSGSMPTSSQVNPQNAKEGFEKFIRNNKNIIHIAFSSGLSGTYHSTKLGAEEVMEEQDCKITVIDSLCASLGEGLMVYMAMQLREQGMGYAELVEWLEKHKQNFCHGFTVDDLFHLHRGGRVSKTAAVVGSMLNLKPILIVDEEGHLAVREKVRGRKQSLNRLVDNMGKCLGRYREEKTPVFISHGDCFNDAKYVAQLVEKKYGLDTQIINFVGPTIGAHTGAGVVALFYLGETREIPEKGGR